MRISYSALETFKRCPLKFKFQYIDKIKTPKSKEAAFGTLLHSALKILHEPGLIIPTEEDILKFINDNWDTAYYSSEQESAMAFAQAIKIMKEYYAKNYPADFNVLALETPFEVPIQIRQELHLITGKIDRVDKTADGALEVIDYKTAKKMPSQEAVDKDLQLAVYHLGVANRWPSLTQEGRGLKTSLYFLKHGEKLSTTRTPQDLAATKASVIKDFEIISRAAKEAKFPPTPNALCDWCEFQKSCPYFKHKFKEAKIFFNDQDVKALIGEYTKLNQEIDERDKRLKELKADMSKFMDQEGLERLFGDDGYITRQAIQRFKYDSETLRAILEPLGRWQDVLKVDDVRLKKVAKELPAAKRAKIEEARKLDKEYKILSLKKSTKSGKK
ncbi:PD-(D/E)XK nuclease family protein [Patescibacteria group bacterium]|nr:PD-(D/E)XK nuclease family protein [Patescibacteria group bacterium]MBU2265182.1 PD-(D/E)XK nuclease family protein [Patescibacteria group bacterium]